MSDRRSCDRDARTERAGRLLQASSIEAAKVRRALTPCAHLRLPLSGVDRAVEVKCRTAGRKFYDWLDQRDLLIVEADRQEPLVVLGMSLAVEIAAVGRNDRGPT
jgi:hypothetical protein